MFGPVQLTHFMYVLLAVVFVCVLGYVIYYNARQDKELKKAEGAGARPQTKAEEIVVAMHQSEADARQDQK